MTFHVLQPPKGVAARLADLVARHGLPAGSEAALGRLLGLLAYDPTAPTTVTEPRRAVDVHVADSLAALVLDPVREARTVADLGTGAGFPGLPLAVALPRARVHLVESVGRKAAFLRRVVEAMGAGDVEVVPARAEDWRAGLGGMDVVCARAVAPLDVLVEYAAPLLREGGILVAWKGRRDAAEEAAGARAASVLGLEPVEVRRVEPWPEARDHHLHVVAKRAPTPPGFPRRAGLARKRPLGGRASS